MGGPPKKAFVFGEIHGRPETFAHMTSVLDGLSKSGVKNLALEIPSTYQDSFESCCRATLRGVENVSMGMRGAGGARDETPYDMKLYFGLGAHAMRLGMNVKCVDSPGHPDGVREQAEIDRLSAGYIGGTMTARDYVRDTKALDRRRNEYMADQIGKLDGDTILLTGARHTGGDGSVEDCIRARGMTAVSKDFYPEGAVDHGLARETTTSDLEPHPAGTKQPPDINAMIAALRGGCKAAEPLKLSAPGVSGTTRSFTLGREGR